MLAFDSPDDLGYIVSQMKRLSIKPGLLASHDAGARRHVPPAPRRGSIHIALQTGIKPAKVAQIRRLSRRLVVCRGATAQDLHNAHVIHCEGPGLDPALYPNLAFVQTDSSAVHHLVDSPLARSGIAVCNVRGAYTPAVAEFAISLMLSLTRRLPRCAQLQASSTWVDDYVHGGVRGINCCGKTLGIIGYGSIGRQVARIAHAMGMRVMVCKRRPQDRRQKPGLNDGVGDSEGKLPASWFSFEQLPRMLPKLDVCMITLPLTAQTRGLMNGYRLAMLPRRALLINVGRGGIVDEGALRDALHRGDLAGAALDVLQNEPLPSSSTLWQTPNLIITPHIASYTDEQPDLAADVLLENLRRWLAGEPLINVVDFEQGY
jgi:phosphoglycerate dehydrogenase-like enzyme